MRPLRNFLCAVYAIVSLSLLLALFQTPSQLLHFGQPRNSFDVWFGWLFYPGGVFVYGAAALTYWRRWRTAKFWALFLASVNVALALFLLIGLLLGGSVGFALGLALLLLVPGLLGLVAFWRWRPSVDEKEKAFPVAGDGTNRVLNVLVWVLAGAGYYFGMEAWDRWAAGAHLPRGDALPIFAAIVAAELVMVLIHEAGHALCGLALGMKLRAFIVGPFQWRVVGARWKFAFRPAQFLATGGATVVIPTNTEDLVSRRIKVIVAGPLASLAGGLMGFWMVTHAAAHSWDAWWRTVAIFTTMSVLAFVMNLVPFQTGTSQYSDGAQIYQLIRGGPWAEYHTVLSLAGATCATGLRPRDIDPGAIERAAAVVNQGPRGFLLRLIAHSCYQDRSQQAAASHSLRLAEAIYEDSPAKIIAELHYSVVTDAAIQQRDRAKARLWWDRAEAKKPKQITADYWMARSALAWIEGKTDEAGSAWAKADEYLQGMPRTGTYEFDRDCLAALKKTIENEAVAPVPELVG